MLFKSRILIGLLGMQLVFVTGCVSSMSELNRRPYADKMPLIAFTNKGLGSAKSIGKKSVVACSRRFNLVMTFGGEPNYNELKSEIYENENIKYMTNVKSIEHGTSGFILGKTCVGFEGEAFQ